MKKYFLVFVGVDAYEASLELGADGMKKGRQLGLKKIFQPTIQFHLWNDSFLAEQTVELGRDKGNWKEKRFISMTKFWSCVFCFVSSQWSIESKSTCR